MEKTCLNCVFNILDVYEFPCYGCDNKARNMHCTPHELLEFLAKLNVERNKEN